MLLPRPPQNASVSNSAAEPDPPTDATDADAGVNDGDMFPVVLDERGARELASTLQAHAQAIAQSQVEPPPAPSPVLASPVAFDSRETKDQVPVAAPSGRPSARMYSNLGIQCIARVKRNGVKCFHCNGGIDKGDLRFEYVFRLDKPARSIHCFCLAQIDRAACAPSLSVLRTLTGKPFTDDPEALAACQDALELLTCMA